jgi:hypothetical protein
MSETKTNPSSRSKRLSSGELKAIKFLMSNIELYLNKALEEKLSNNAQTQIHIALSNLKTAQHLSQDK